MHRDLFKAIFTGILAVSSYVTLETEAPQLTDLIFFFLFLWNVMQPAKLPRKFVKEKPLLYIFKIVIIHISILCMQYLRLKSSFYCKIAACCYIYVLIRIFDKIKFTCISTRQLPRHFFPLFWWGHLSHCFRHPSMGGQKQVLISRLHTCLPLSTVIARVTW